ncbi:MAG: putative acyl-CoA thioesterase [Frankiales bacterium]|nr:putative acyl-CoA thioesterase [Frankiales bacterium]
MTAEPAGELDEGVADLLSLLELEEVEPDLYRAKSPVLRGRRNIFGGQVMAQALRAASRTVEPDRLPHSLHGYFLREGLFETDVIFQVERSRDGRSFNVRHVTARQNGKIIFLMTASFHKDEPGRSFESPMREVGAPPPPDWVDDVTHRQSSIGVDIQPGPEISVDDGGPAYLIWTRTRGEMPADRGLNAAVAAYMSDMGAGGVAGNAIGVSAAEHGTGSLVMASVDHAIWFHRPIRADDWLLIDAVPVSNGGARGLVRGTIHNPDGVHVASFAQELLIRER